MSRLEVIVPMKPLASAKSRLAGAMPDLRRRALALLLLQRVFGSVGAAVGPEACVVAGGDDGVRRLAEAAGCRWTAEAGRGLNSSLWSAMTAAYDAGASAALFLPADLPEIAPADVSAVVSASDGLLKPVGVRARGDGGTNALLLPAGCAFRPALGDESYRRHSELAAAEGKTLEAAVAPGLEFDIDTPDDLAWALAHLPGLSVEMDRWEEWLRLGGVSMHPMTGGEVLHGAAVPFGDADG